MAKYLGLDLGTNSIGWSIRDNDVVDTVNQIIDYGVVVFKKGVGEGKSGEYSLAAERRTNRSKRRLYNAKRYRKWATLKVLSQYGMCPLSEEELRLWSIGNWIEISGKKKNAGRNYPTSPDFVAWLAMDFDKIGREWDGEKLSPEFANIYQLRISLLENNIPDDPYQLYKIGRAFYHLCQRRGFRTSRKNGNSAYGTNEYFDKAQKENPDLKAAQILQNGLTNENRRIRNSGVIQRRFFEEEFNAICDKQKLSATQKENIYKAIYYVRPLRSQKGLVGKCTIEKSKTRIPISHPAYEEFRALTYINNIKWRETGSKKLFESIPLSLKKNILEKLFFRRLEKGANKGKVHSESYFEFSEIVKHFSENFKYEFNFARYKNEKFELTSNPNVATCPVIAGLMNVFGSDWKNIFITDDKSYGINWEGLRLNYIARYNEIEKPKSLDYVAIWHLLYDFLQIKDQEAELVSFCENVLKWDKIRTSEFIDIGISQGYGSLSFTAIAKILPFLREENIYSEAVSFANLKCVLGAKDFDSKQEKAKIVIKSAIQKVEKEKQLLNITNGLIQGFFAENNTHRAKGFNSTIEEITFYNKEIESKLVAYFGVENWAAQSIEEKRMYQTSIFDLYICFLEGKQLREDKASFRSNKNPEIDYYKLPRLDECIKQELINKCDVSKKGLEYLYHHSDIEIYPKSKSGELENPNPPSKGWKNPMAMRTMYELRKVVNYLLQEGKIDVETKVIVEMARELNDANRRAAIQMYQKNREEENKEFARAILGVAKERYPNLNENDADNIDKVRLWWELLENSNIVYKQVKELKDDVAKYRIWKEQECQCLYTGKTIGITDLFDGTKFQFEHTLHLSESYDNSLTNLTVCDADYNMRIKKNQIPTQLKNYNENWGNYPAIEPKLKKWKDKVKNIKDQIEKNRKETKKATNSDNIKRKNELIQARHLLEFDLEYWEKKLQTFTVKQIPNWWKNSQLVDTQIISKYARAYLKTVFNKVDVQKGTITALFKKIYGIMGAEKKDRSKHSHHAIDAAVLTLIPGSARRDLILDEYFIALENRVKYRRDPYSNFHIDHVKNIENMVLANHVSKDQTLNSTRKYVRKRGNIQYIKDKNGVFATNENGDKIPKIMQGDGIRGKLHADSYYGAIKVNERINGFPQKADGKYKLIQKNGQDEIWLVVRKDIAKIDFEKDVIIDEVLKIHLLKQIANGEGLDKLVDKANNPIRHLRCRVKAGRGFLTKEKAIELKRHSHLSTKIHKQKVLAQNEENYLYLLYEGKKSSGETDRVGSILSLIKYSQLEISDLNEIWKDSTLNIINIKNSAIPLKYIIRVGTRVIFFTESKYGLKELSQRKLNDRVFNVYKFNEQGSPYIFLQNHIEARPDKELGDGDLAFQADKYQSRLKLKADKLSFIVEGLDFSIHPDGNIILNY
jgi:CRISPR-associated endonuclease Csn1